MKGPIKFLGGALTCMNIHSLAVCHTLFKLVCELQDECSQE